MMFPHAITLDPWKISQELISVYDLIRACILEKNAKNLSMYTRLLSRQE